MPSATTFCELEPWCSDKPALHCSQRGITNHDEEKYIKPILESQVQTFQRTQEVNRYLATSGFCLSVMDFDTGWR